MREIVNSGEKIASALIYGGPCILMHVTLISAGGGGSAGTDPKLILDDSLAGSGTVRGEWQLDTSIEGGSKDIPIPNGRFFKTGLNATLTGTGASFVLDYIPFAAL